MRRIKQSVSCMLLIAFAGSLQAQDDSSLVQVVTFSVNPGMNAQFEEVVAAFREASQAQGAGNYWLSAQSISGDPVYRFHLEVSNWGSLSDPGPNLAEHFGEAEAARLAGLMADSIASVHTAFYREQASMSHIPEGGFATPPEGIIYVDFTLNAGTAPGFYEMVEAQKVASTTLYPDEYFGVSTPEYGASGPRTVLIIQSFGDLDSPSLGAAQRLIEHFGETEGGRLTGLAQQAIASFETSLFRTRPDLNHQPAN